MGRFPRNETGQTEVAVDEWFFVSQTEEAVLVTNGTAEKWIPKSQMLDGTDDPDQAKEGEFFYMVLPEWLAINEELI